MPIPCVQSQVLEKNTEPVVYQKMGAQTLSIELINDELWGLTLNKPLDTSALMIHQTSMDRLRTYDMVKNGETDYTKLKVLHKGIITKISKTGTRLYFLPVMMCVVSVTLNGLHRLSR